MTEESKPSGPTSPEQAVEQARALNEQILETARQVDPAHLAAQRRRERCDLNTPAGRGSWCIGSSKH